MSKNLNEDLKAKMRAALEKKNKSINVQIPEQIENEKKLSSGQQSSGGPKMHRRKSGSA